MKAVRELNRELPRLYNRGQLEHRDVIFLIGKVREILENKGAYKEKFPVLNLFCNWCLHTKLSSSNTIYRALLNVSIALSKATNVPPDGNSRDLTSVFIDVGSNILDIPKLRQGLKIVLKDQGIDSTIASNKNWWDAFVKILLYEISEKPIEFPQKVIKGKDTKSKAYQFYKEILDLPHALDHDKIICLKVVNDEGRFSGEGEESVFALQFTTVSEVHFVVQLFGKENEDEFSS